MDKQELIEAIEKEREHYEQEDDDFKKGAPEIFEFILKLLK